MLKGQAFTEEILRRREGPPDSVRYTAASYRLDELKRDLQKAGDNVRTVTHLVPVRVVACMEGCLKAAAAELINYGDPYLQRSRNLASQVRLDFDILTALLGQRITVGEMIVHSLKWQNLEANNSQMSTLLNADFFQGLRLAKDRWHTDEGDNPTVIVTDFDKMIETLKEAIRVRQILCHEVAPFLTLSAEQAEEMLTYGWQFTHATSWFVSETLYPNAPLTQSAMTEAAWDNAGLANTELDSTFKEFLGKLDDEDCSLLEQSQQAWTTYRDTFALFESHAAKGGTLSPQLQGMAHEKLTRSRIRELRDSILFKGWENTE